MKILTIIGTRPEAIKMAPLIKSFEISRDVNSKLCVTGQHREMLEQVLTFFEIKPDYDLNIMKKNQNLFDVTSGILVGIKTVLEDFQPDLVLVHGDTTTTLAASLAAFYKRIPIGHIEAGLRSGDNYSPWPEEVNRKLTSSLASIHFAPTKDNKENLIGEGIDKNKIYVTGNTVIDALLWTSNKLHKNKTLYKSIASNFPFLRKNALLILITGHRRENFGKGIENICLAIKELANKYKKVDFVYASHPNPNVLEPVKRILKDIINIYIVEPQEYIHFVYLMTKAYVIISDSGGIQEEGAALKKPIFVTREITERKEGLLSGGVKLVGTNKAKIVMEIEKILTDSVMYKKMILSKNPYGDGKASQRIKSKIIGRGTFE